MANAYDNYHGAGAWDNAMASQNNFMSSAGVDQRRITSQQQQDGWLQKNIYENGAWRPLTPQDGYGAQGGPTVGAGMGQQPQFQGGAQTPPYGGYLGGAGQGGAQGPANGGQWGTSAGTSGATNPYLSNMADEIGRRSQQGLDQSFNAIRSNAIGVGGLGGSRQGVAQGVATGMANDALTGNLANLYGTDWTNQQNRDLTKYQADQNYDINGQNTRNAFYTSQRGQDISSVGLGADMYSKGMNGQWDPIKNANSVYAPYGGNGSTAESGGTNWQQILAGLGGGLKMAKDMGWTDWGT